MKKGMLLKLDSATAKMFLVNCRIGTSALLNDAKQYSDPLIVKQKVDDAKQFSHEVNAILERVREALREGNDSFEFDLTFDEIQKIFFAVRISFETCLTNNIDEIYRILGIWYVMTNNESEAMTSTEIATNAFALLDFLECHCDDRILIEWRDRRRDRSRTLLNIAAEKVLS